MHVKLIYPSAGAGDLSRRPANEGIDLDAILRLLDELQRRGDKYVVGSQGLNAYGKIVRFVQYASGSAEALWHEVETVYRHAALGHRCRFSNELAGDLVFGDLAQGGPRCRR